MTEPAMRANVDLLLRRPVSRRGRRRRDGLLRLALVVLSSMYATSAEAAAPPALPAPAPPAPVPTPPATPVAAGAKPPPITPAAAVPPTAAPPAPAVEPPASTGEPGVVAALPQDAPLATRVIPVGDAHDTESDHDAVAGAWGIDVRPVSATLPVFARRASTGCPDTTTTGATTTGAMATTTDCPAVTVSALGVRYWLGRNLALNGGLAFALGGGSATGRLLDSYFGVGPTVGASVLLGNWRHLAVMASPELSFVMFKAAGSADTAYVTDLRAVLEAELHFGFIGVPALSLSIRSGLLLRLEHAADVTLWSVGVSGATSVRGLLTDLSLRYYF